MSSSMKDLVLGLLAITIFLFIFLGIPTLMIYYGGPVGMIVGLAWLFLLSGV